MGLISTTAASVFRDFVADIPPDAHEPVKADIRSLFTAVDDEIAAARVLSAVNNGPAFAAILAGIEARERAFVANADTPKVFVSQTGSVTNVVDSYVSVTSQTIRPTTGRLAVSSMLWASNATGGATTLYGKIEVSNGFVGYILYETCANGDARMMGLDEVVQGLVSGTEYTVTIKAKQSGTASGFSIYGKILAEG